jgi:hypothetical protein
VLDCHDYLYGVVKKMESLASFVIKNIFQHVVLSFSYGVVKYADVNRRYPCYK